MGTGDKAAGRKKRARGWHPASKANQMAAGRTTLERSSIIFSAKGKRETEGVRKRQRKVIKMGILIPDIHTKYMAASLQCIGGATPEDCDITLDIKDGGVFKASRTLHRVLSMWGRQP